MPHRSIAHSTGSLETSSTSDGGMKPHEVNWVRSSRMVAWQITPHLRVASMQTSFTFLWVSSSGVRFMKPPLFTTRSLSGSRTGCGNFVMQSLTSDSIDLSSSTCLFRKSFCSCCS